MSTYAGDLKSAILKIIEYQWTTLSALLNKIVMFDKNQKSIFNSLESKVQLNTFCAVSVCLCTFSTEPNSAKPGEGD